MELPQSQKSSRQIEQMAVRDLNGLLVEADQNLQHTDGLLYRTLKGVSRELTAEGQPPPGLSLKNNFMNGGRVAHYTLSKQFKNHEISLPIVEDATRIRELNAELLESDDWEIDTRRVLNYSQAKIRENRPLNQLLKSTAGRIAATGSQVDRYLQGGGLVVGLIGSIYRLERQADDILEDNWEMELETILREGA